MSIWPMQHALAIITKKVKDAILNQVIHCLNGCLDPAGRLTATRLH